MSFVSVRFFLFIAAFLFCYKLTERNNKVQKCLILIGNYVFYSLISIKFAAVLLLISVVTWFIASRKKSKALMAIGIVINVLVLLFFKYIGLFGDIAEKYSIAFPIGLSFYIFEAISLIVDSYKGKIEDKITLVDTLVYLSFFPTVISGPIIKARDYLPQLKSSHVMTLANFSIGIQRFALGAFEKFVIADRLASSVDAVYSAPEAYSGVSLLWNTISYSLQLFFDFAGYSNMAIGIGIILGFTIKENFNLPYIAKNPSDFWRRWHISLSSWITDYLYIPLGGSRKGTIRTYANIVIVMLISGMWHGSSLNFLIWGLGHGLAQVAYKLISNGKGESSNKVTRALGVVVTFILVNLLWIPFRAKDISTTLIVLRRIITFADGLTYLFTYTFIFLALLIVVEVYAIVKNGGDNPIKPMNLGTFKGKFVFVTLIMLTLMFAYFGNGAFIYGAIF